MRANLEALSNTESQFRTVRNELEEILRTLDHLTRSISQERTLERFRPELTAVTRQTAGLTRDMIVMSAVLEAVVEDCAEAERRIRDNACDDRLCFFRRPTGLIEVPHFEQVPVWGEWFGEERVYWVPWLPPD